MRTSIALLTVAAATLAAGACARDDLTSPSTPEISGGMLVETSATSKGVRVDRAEVIATADLAHGGVVTFLDLGDGHIGIAERAPVQARFVSLAMIENLKATPLEVYLALSPRNAGVPDALLRDHQRPRVLAPPPADATGLEYAAGYYGCASPGNAWIAGWKAEYLGITKYREAAYFPGNTIGTTFYPGAPVYYGTNTNSATYLGACNADAIEDLWMEVHRRINGNWVMLYGTTLMHDSKHTFYSGMPASYRGVVTALFDGSLIEDFGVGAAWTLSPRVASP